MGIRHASPFFVVITQLWIAQFRHALARIALTTHPSGNRRGAIHPMASTILDVIQLTRVFINVIARFTLLDHASIATSKFSGMGEILLIALALNTTPRAVIWVSHGVGTIGTVRRRFFPTCCPRTFCHFIGTTDRTHRIATHLPSRALDAWVFITRIARAAIFGIGFRIDTFLRLALLTPLLVVPPLLVTHVNGAQNLSRQTPLDAFALLTRGTRFALIAAFAAMIAVCRQIGA